MATAQETYDWMMKSQIAPRLRALGFKGSGQSYELPSPDHWVMLGFQKSQWSDAADVRFTVNVLVVSRELWDEQRKERAYLPARPTANRLWGEFVWQRRIGRLLPAGEDIWWEVKPGMPTEQVADIVLRAVEDHALPAVRARTAA